MPIAPYGTWVSPISAQLASSSSVSFQDLILDGEDIYWTETRPTEGGRSVIVKKSPKQEAKDILPKDFSARNRVHEYGGGAFCVHQGVVYFTNFSDQRLYKMLPAQMPLALTPPDVRFAEYSLTASGIVAVGESHEDPTAVKNFIALIDPTTGEVRELTSGYDFYAFPTLSKELKNLAWICWNHPNMPWDDTELWCAALKEKKLVNLQQIDKETIHQSFFQPQWDKDEKLVVVSDKSNWWNLYEVKKQNLALLFEVESEIGRPLWNLGASTWGFYKGAIVCTFSEKGKGHLFLFKDKQLTPIDLPFHTFSQIRTDDNKIAFIGSAPDRPRAIATWNEQEGLTIIRENMSLDLSKDALSIPSHLSFDVRNRKAHAYFYPPTNQHYQGPPLELPPLIVKSHGGPTANCGADLNLDIQYWTSRGFAVLDVNYAGSTGYGRKFRQSLEKNWGVYDIEDCVSGAQFVAKKGWVDQNKLAITGGSAGGYTTLAALTFTDVFHVGASHYGVSDLESLAKETHKFESKYLDKLIGPYPEEKATYQSRSPLSHSEKLCLPVIFFQGDEDKIVPPSQAEILYKVLKAKGIKTEYYLFEGEQHGFRKAENRITALEAQRKFFMEVLRIGV